MRIPSTLAFAAAFAVLVLSARADAEPTLSLNSDGGDAWSFRKRIEGTLDHGACDDIFIATGTGEFRATRLGGTFFATVDLTTGENVLQAVCRDGNVEMARSAPQHWTVRLADKPKAWARAVVTQDGLILDGGRTETASARPAPIIRYEWTVAAQGVPREAIVGRRVPLALGLPDGDHTIRLRVTDGLGRTDDAATVVRVRNGKAVAVDLAREHPAWVDEAVVYGAVPFLFGARGLADITDRLDAIAELGATVVWLSPIAASPGDDFGYAVTDPFTVRDGVGNEADLRELIRAAHARGLRVMLDFVPNHVSDQHPYYLDVGRRGSASPYTRFFDRDAKGDVTSYFSWTNLKNLNFDNDEVQRYVIEAATRWIRDFDVDGFRVDASWGIRERAPEFWPRWREELKRIKPDIFLLAEASARDSYYFAHGFDAAYDWTEKLGEWAWQDVFVEPGWLTGRLRAALSVTADGPTMRFLENNDTGARFVTRYGADLTRAAAAMLFTVPGIPLLYAGQEIGAAFEPYGPRQAVDWTKDPHRLRPFYGQLARLRAAHPALRGRAIHLIDVAPSEALLAYLRPGATPREDVIVLLNFLDQPTHVRLSGEARDLAGNDRRVDLMSGEVITGLNGLAMPRFGVRILARPTDQAKDR